MKMLAISTALLVAAAAPALAQQEEWQRRIEENLRVAENERQLDQIRQLEQRLDTIELKQQMQNVMRQFDEQDARAPVITFPSMAPQYQPPPPPPPTSAQLAEMQRRQQAMMEASARRIEQLAEEINNNR